MKIVEILINYITQVYMIYLLTKCYAHISYTILEKKRNLKLFLTVSLTSILFTINNLYNFTEYKVLISFLLEFITFKICFNEKTKDTALKTIIIVIFTAGLELILSLLLLINSSLLANGISIITKAIFSLIIFKLSDIIIRQDKVRNIIQKIINFMKNLIFFEITLILIVIIIDLMLFFRSENFGSKFNFLTILISIIYISFTLIQIIKSKYTIEKIEAKNKELTNSYKASSIALEQFRELKHNLNNDLYSIKTVLPENKQILVNNIISKYNSNYNWLNNVTDIPEGLQGIIYLKKIEAEKHKVKLNVNYNSTKNIDEKDFLDLCDVLGIYLDNAIEASKEAKNKNIVLDIIDYKDSMILKVINEFSNFINLNEIGNKNYSTKKRNSGLGLNYINKIKNKNIKTKIQIVNSLFIAYIEYTPKANKKRK